MKLFLFLCVAHSLCLAKVEAVTSSLPPLNDAHIQANIEVFFKSIIKIASLNNEKFRHVSKQITVIGAKLNQSTSECYGAITATLNQGFNQSWSSKSKSFSRFYAKELIKMHLNIRKQ